MNKYIYVFKMGLCENTLHFFSWFWEFVFFLLTVFVLISVWGCVYSDVRVIKGYTFEQLVWYTILAQSLWYGLNRKKFIDDMYNEIRTGNVMFESTKPYDHLSFVILEYVGCVCGKVFVFFTFGILVGLYFESELHNFNVRNVFVLFPVYVLGIVIYSIMFTCVNLLSFWIRENKSIIWSYNKIIIMLGVIFPLEMLPSFFQPIVKFTPIFVSMYGPLKLTIDFSLSMFVQLVFAQILWICVLLMLVSFIYTKGIRRMDVNGD